jgi:arylsulfatase A-like enzyme
VVHLKQPATAGLLLVLAVACTSVGNVGSDRTTRPTLHPKVPNSGVNFTPPKITSVTDPPDGWRESACSLPRKYAKLIRRGYYPRRSPDIFIVPREPNWFGTFLTMSHSGPWEYLQRVPLVFYGPGFIRRAGTVRLDREVTLADFAPTVAELIGTDPPPDIRGQVIDGVLLPEAARAETPAVVVTVVWDGGGWNVLNAWPDEWPVLKRMMREGASVEDVIVGSSPSVTPSIHTTLGTGTWPRRHGIIGIEQRVGDNPQTGAFAHRTPSNLLVPTLADVYDKATGNVAEIGMFAFKSWHLGMSGHGAYLDGGDKDIGVILNQSETFTGGPQWYEIPTYLHSLGGLDRAIRKVDLDDGRLDSSWMGHEVLADPTLRRDTPAWTLFQTKIIETIMRTEGYGNDEVTDLFYTNYKQLDEVGHRWNMVNAEMRESLKYTDRQLLELRRFLDSQVGRNRWVMIVTADHGQAPLPEASGAWPISNEELAADVAAKFDTTSEELFENLGPVGFWLNRKTMDEHGITLEEVADFMVAYRLADNMPEGERIPPLWRARVDELIIESAFPSRETDRIWRCVNGN